MLKDIVIYGWQAISSPYGMFGLLVIALGLFYWSFRKQQKEYSKEIEKSSETLVLKESDKNPSQKLKINIQTKHLENTYDYETWEHTASDITIQIAINNPRHEDIEVRDLKLSIKCDDKTRIKKAASGNIKDGWNDRENLNKNVLLIEATQTETGWLQFVFDGVKIDEIINRDATLIIVDTSGEEHCISFTLNQSSEFETDYQKELKAKFGIYEWIIHELDKQINNINEYVKVTRFIERTYDFNSVMKTIVFKFEISNDSHCNINLEFVESGNIITTSNDCPSIVLEGKKILSPSFIKTHTKEIITLTQYLSTDDVTFISGFKETGAAEFHFRKLKIYLVIKHKFKDGKFLLQKKELLDMSPYDWMWASEKKPFQ